MPIHVVISRLFIVVVVLFVGLLIFLAVESFRSLPTSGRVDGRLRRRKIYRLTLVSVLLLVLSAGVWAFFVEPNRLVVHQTSIQVENWAQELSGLRVAMIADIHPGAPFIDLQKMQKIVELTNEQHPDLIVLLGDYIYGGRREIPNRIEPEVTAVVIKNLHAPLGVYAVLGNHDWWYNGAKVRRALEANGIPVLDNEVAEIKWRGKSFWLAGLADLWTRPQHIDETIAQAPAGATVIALTHNPDIFPNLPQSVPLLLAAHTHGGQVNLPLIGTPIVPSIYGPKYTAGHIIENGHHMFVTTGIGTSIVPIRFRVTPEIVILTIN